MADNDPGRLPDLRKETPMTPQGHRALVWIWIVGIVLLSLAIWGVAKMSTYLQPPPRGNAVNGSNS